jgi:hypothetical protein
MYTRTREPEEIEFDQTTGDSFVGVHLDGFGVGGRADAPNKLGSTK